jgi:hypothetical protein
VSSSKVAAWPEWRTIDDDVQLIVRQSERTKHHNSHLIELSDVSVRRHGSSGPD